MQGNDTMKRRKFLKTAAITGASAGIVTKARGAESNASRARTLKRDLMRIGMVGYGPYSRAKEYTQAINDPSMPPRTNMQVVAVWGREDGYAASLRGTDEWKKKRLDEIQAFAGKENLAKFGIKTVVKRPEDLVPLVDGVFINDPDNALALARPFLAKGMPVLVTSPVAWSIRDARELVRLAKEGGSVLVAGSSVPWLKEFQVARSRINQAGTSVYYAEGLTESFCLSFPDIIETVQMLVGGRIERCATFGISWPRDEDPLSIPQVMAHFQHEKIEQSNPIVGVVTTWPGDPFRNWVAVHTRSAARGAQGGGRSRRGGPVEMGVMMEGSDLPVDTAEHLWLPFLRVVGRAFETGVWPQDEATILQKVEIMLMAHKSGISNGMPVNIKEIEDYSLPGFQTEKA